MRAIFSIRESTRSGGYSLLELIVTLGISSIALLTGGWILSALNKGEKNSRYQREVNNYLNLTFKALERNANSLTPMAFDQPISYGGANFRRLTRITNATPGNHKIVFKHLNQTITIGRGSTNLELASSTDRVAGINRGVMVSRCIPSEDAIKETWNYKDISRLEFHPVPVEDRTGQQSISCCKLGRINPDKCVSLSRDSKFRTRIFVIGQDAINVWPGAGTPPPIVGLSFFTALDVPAAPKNMTFISVVIADNCLHMKDRRLPTDGVVCEGAKFFGKSEIRKLERDFYDSGIVTLGH